MRRRCSRGTTVLFVVIALSSSLSAGGAHAATARNPIVAMSMGYSDYLKNYDFISESDRQDNVDWAVSILAYNSASIDRFKGILSTRGFGQISPNGMHGRASDGSGYRWDRDAGQKGITCPIGTTTPHYRVYADGDQYMYNIGFGHYVYATTHRDQNECGFGTTRHYDIERVEGTVVDAFFSASFPVYHDYGNFANYEPYRTQGEHTWDNNGYASYVDLTP